MKKNVISFELEHDLPDDYEFDGWRRLTAGDLYISEGLIRRWNGAKSIAAYPALRVKEAWVLPEMPRDYGKEARFWEEPGDPVTRSTLQGFVPTGNKWVDKWGNQWNLAEVRHEPAKKETA